jgi:NitT/TauT family transport system substrate-binding protein
MVRRPVFSIAAFACLAALPAHAELGELRIAQQPGISYLPLTILHSEKLVEAEAAKVGINDLKVTWAQFGAGNAMNEALLSASLDIASGGVGPLVTIWSKTKGTRQEVKGISALNSMPISLVSVNPDVKTIKDLTAKDKIGLPAVKVSIQAVTLQMAAEQAFGAAQYGKLDPLTVSMRHPDAMAAMLSGTEVTAHFGSAPFQYQELQDKRAHLILNSYAVIGGAATFNTVWTSRKFHDDNPKLYGAFLAALRQAMVLIQSDPRKAAEIYIKEEKSNLAPDFLVEMLKDPENVFTTTPQNVMKYAEFMQKTGTVEKKPVDWKELFFPEIHAGEGS